MTILSVFELEMAFGENVLFSDISFEVNENDKIGLVGVNGSGKTTLFKMLNKSPEPEKGVISKTSGLKIGYMEQHVIRDNDISVFNEAVSVFNHLIETEVKLEKIHNEIDNANHVDEKLLHTQMELQEYFERNSGLTYKSRTLSALGGLGFSGSDLEKPLNVLSGGEKSKLQLAKLLLSDINLMLLDEPTNHLDIKASEWLEKFLQDYKGAFIVISHDRYFLDKVTNRTIEIENKRLIQYKGNYSEFLRKKEADREARQKKYDLTMNEIKRIEGIIEQQKRFNQAHNYVTIAHKQKSIDRLQATLDKPESAPKALRFNFKCRDGSGNDVLLLKNVALSLGNRLLFKNAYVDIKKKERVFLLGANGSGKTSLFRIITGDYKADFGEVKFGARIDTGYYDQIQTGLHDEKTVMNEIWDEFPKMTQTEVRTALGQFLFHGDDVFRKIKKLSGGEKARVSLLKLMLHGSNLLLLDEPTNHLDITSREALENALLGYPGTLFIISHDRYLINKLADRIYELDENGITEYGGDYDYYLERKENGSLNKQNTETEKSESSNNDEDYWRKKERESEKRKLAGKITRLEEKIAKLEKRQAEINERLTQPEVTGDYEQVAALTGELGDIDKELEDTMMQWSELEG